MTLLFSACTHYQTTKISKNRVMVSKTTNVFWFFGGTIFTCDTDDHGIIDTCIENEIETSEQKQERIEKEEQNFQRQNQFNKPVSSEYPKSTKLENSSPPKEIIKSQSVANVSKNIRISNRSVYKGNFLSINAGPSISSQDVDLGNEINKATFNYSVGYFTQGYDYLLGGIYHVSAYRMYGSVPVPGSTTKYDPFEAQANINLLGASYRKYASSVRDTSPYLRADGGLAWTTSGKSVILSPFEKMDDMGLGANLGVGLAFKTGFGSINLDIFQTLYAGGKSDQLSSGMTNFSLGVMF